jgi:hypothetical protein
MEPPVYKDGDSVALFLLKMRDYSINLKKNNYNLIFNFVNSWLEPYNVKLRSLTDFKNFSEGKIKKFEKHNKRTVKNNYKLFKELGIDPKYDSDDDTEDVPEYEIIKFISKILKKIDYKLNKKVVGDEYIYWISPTSLNI